MATTTTNQSRPILGRHEPNWIGPRSRSSYFTELFLGLREYDLRIPESGFLFFLAICAAIYWLVRGWVWARDRLLWSLRNRLVAAYVFIAVVPVLLLLAMAGLAAYLLYWQLGSYVIYTEMEEREERVGVVATALATSYAAEATLGRTAAALALPVAPDTYIKNAMTELPGLKIETGKGEELLRRRTECREGPFPGACLQRRAARVAGRGRPPDSHRTHFGFRGCSRHAGADRYAGAGTWADPVQRSAPEKAATSSPISNRDQPAAVRIRGANRHARAPRPKGRESF